LNARKYPNVQALLRHSILQVRQDRNTGTAFRVAQGLALTCAHVVEGNGSIRVKWPGGEGSALLRAPGLLLKDDAYPERRWPDLALLDIPADDMPLVLLGEETALGDPLYAFGYSDIVDGEDSSTFEIEGPTAHPPRLKLKGGQVRSGMSGAPLLNLRTGCVVGVLGISRDIETDLGGRATTTTTIFEKIRDLPTLQARHHAHSPDWLLALDSSQREELRAAAKRRSLQAVDDAIAACVVAGLPSVWALAFPDVPPLGIWRPIGPRGGYTFCVAVDPRNSDRLFVGMRNYGGLYVSLNRGRRFERVDSFPKREEIHAIVIAPDDGRVFAATEDGLLVSEDAGSSWQFSPPESRGEEVLSIALAPFDSNRIACGTRRKGGVTASSSIVVSGDVSGKKSHDHPLTEGFRGGHFHLSLDRGQRWQALEQDNGIHGIAFSAQDNSKIYLTSADTGRCYCLHGEGLRTLDAFPGRRPTFIAVAPDNDDVVVVGGHDGLFASRDGGTTWTQEKAVEGFVNRVRFVGTNEAIAATPHGVLSSTDAGASWAPVGGPPFLWTIDLDFSQNEDTWAATDGAGIFRRSRGQRDWTHFGQDLPSLPCFDLAAAAGRMFVGTTAGLFIGDMNGRVWQATGLQSKWVVDVLAHAPEIGNDGVLPARLLIAREVQQVALTQSTASRVLLARVVDEHPWGRLWHSHDDGRTFAPVNDLTDRKISRLTRSADSPNRWWAASDRGIFESRDAGFTWSLLAENPDAPPAAAIVGCGDDVRAIEFTNQESGEHAFAMAGDPLGRAPALGATLSGRLLELNGELQETARRGTAPLPDGGSRNGWIVLLASEYATGVLLMGTHYGLYASVDAGFAWRLLACGVLDEKVAINRLKIVQSNPAIVHVCTRIGLFRIDLRDLIETSQHR
jgi:photosystem II stability/assembly factor-like uncharacterized protein